jgi:hypothetical protein
LTLASLVGGGAWFAVDVFTAYQNWRANNIQERQLAAFEEANDLTRQQALTGGRVMLHRTAPVPIRSAARPFPLWRALPPMVLFLVALAVSGYEIYDRHFAEPSTASPPPRTMITDNKNWFRIGDADKWKVQQALRDAGFRGLRFQIVRYDTAQCEDLGQDLQEIFEAAGAVPQSVPGMPHGSLGKGITLSGSTDTIETKLQAVLMPLLGYRFDIERGSQPSGPLVIAIGNPPES